MGLASLEHLFRAGHDVHLFVLGLGILLPKTLLFALVGYHHH